MGMLYRDLSIQTQREAPNNARTPGFAFLVRAGYLTRENKLTALGEYAVNHLRGLFAQSGDSFFELIRLPIIGNDEETFFPIASGSTPVAHCPECKYTDRVESARFAKSPAPREAEKPIEKVATPDCHTIEALANYLNVPKEKTAKALMFTRLSDGRFIFVVVRGDMQLSESKLKKLTGDVRAATNDEIERAGASAGYASPIGLKNALIVVDDLIPQSHNLAAGANEDGYHLLNTNCPRDYQADIVADLAQAQENDQCAVCSNSLDYISCTELATRKSTELKNVLLALAETYHDEKGLTLPHPSAAFDVYLLSLSGKELDTRAEAEKIYSSLKDAGISVLFDDRDERAGVKFNDADLIGCPIRLTVGEKNLVKGLVEIKGRRAIQNDFIPINDIIPALRNLK